MMWHGIKTDLTPTTLGGMGRMLIDGESLKFEFDGEKLYWEISKLSEEDMESLEFFELNSPYSSYHNTRRSKKNMLPDDIPVHEWRKRLGLVPEDVILKTLENTT